MAGSSSCGSVTGEAQALEPAWLCATSFCKHMGCSRPLVQQGQRSDHIPSQAKPAVPSSCSSQSPALSEAFLRNTWLMQHGAHGHSWLGRMLSLLQRQDHPGQLRGALWAACSAMGAIRPWGCRLRSSRHPWDAEPPHKINEIVTGWSRLRSCSRPQPPPGAASSPENYPVECHFSCLFLA